MLCMVGGLGVERGRGVGMGNISENVKILIPGSLRVLFLLLDFNLYYMYLTICYHAS